MIETTTDSQIPPTRRLLIADKLDPVGVVCACALSRAYREENGEEPLLRVGSAEALDVAKAFDKNIGVVEAGSGAQPSWDNGDETGIDLSAAAPEVDLGGQKNIVCGTLADNLRVLLRLPEDAPLAFPNKDTEAQSEGRALAASAGVTQGHSLLILAPPAHLRILVHAHFSALAVAAAAKGLNVFALDDDAGWRPLGAKVIRAPRRLLPSLAEEAGWTVAIASADSLLVGAARGRKTFVHLRRGDIAVRGARALGLSADAFEFGFAFEGESPDDFAARVLGFEEDLPVPAVARLSGAVTSEELETVDCVATLRGAVTQQKRGLLTKRPTAIRLLNVPPRTHPRLSADVAAVLASFSAEARKEDRYYVCRDAGSGFDYFEEVDVRSLGEGVYAWADGPHTVLRVGKSGLKPHLGASARRKVLDRTVFELGHYQHIGRSVATPPHVAFLHRDRPIELGGFQLLRGWNDLEHWGVWSAGEASAAKFSVFSPPTAPVTLELESKIFVSQISGVLNLDVEVNRQPIVRFSYEESQNTLLRITMEPEVLASGTAYIVFHHRFPRSPAALGLGPDHRHMALGLVTANLRHGP